MISTFSLFSQHGEKNITYLKNGSIIKGQILEIVPDSTIKIQTSDGSIFIYEMSEVDRIEKDTIVAPIRRVGAYPVPRSAAAYTALPYNEKKERRKGAFSFFGRCSSSIRGFC